MNSQRYSLILLLTGLLADLVGLQANADGDAALWIDVRTAEDLTQGRLVGVVHIPHDEISERISEVSTDKDQPIHLFCRSGNRAQIALQTLKEMGYTHLHNEGSLEDAAAARPDLETECSAC